MSENKTLTIGRDEAVRAMNDDKFLSSFPEFRTIKSKSDVLKQSVNSGCSSCRKRRIAQSVLLEFLNVLSTLPTDEVVKIKQYFGAGNLLYTLFDKNTGTYKSMMV